MKKKVVGCTIDVGTKIYAARVDALHQNTYQMLSGLGHQNNGEEESANGGNATRMENGDGGEEGLDDEDGEEQSGNKKAKSKKKRIKKSSHIVDNDRLETITSKLRDEFIDVCT